MWCLFRLFILSDHEDPQYFCVILKVDLVQVHEGHCGHRRVLLHWHVLNFLFEFWTIYIKLSWPKSWERKVGAFHKLTKWTDVCWIGHVSLTDIQVVFILIGTVTPTHLLVFHWDKSGPLCLDIGGGCCISVQSQWTVKEQLCDQFLCQFGRGCCISVQSHANWMRPLK